MFLGRNLRGACPAASSRVATGGGPTQSKLITVGTNAHSQQVFRTWSRKWRAGKIRAEGSFLNHPTGEAETMKGTRHVPTSPLAPGTRLVLRFCTELPYLRVTICAPVTVVIDAPGEWGGGQRMSNLFADLHLVTMYYKMEQGKASLLASLSA